MAHRLGLRVGARAVVPWHLDLRPLAEELDLRRLLMTQFDSPSGVAQVAVGGATRLNRAVRAFPPPSPHKVTQAVTVGERRTPAQ